MDGFFRLLRRDGCYDYFGGLLRRVVTVIRNGCKVIRAIRKGCSDY